MKKVVPHSLSISWGNIGNMLLHKKADAGEPFFHIPIEEVRARAFAFAEALRAIYDDLTEEQKTKIQEVIREEMYQQGFNYYSGN